MGSLPHKRQKRSNTAPLNYSASSRTSASRNNKDSTCGRKVIVKGNSSLRAAGERVHDGISYELHTLLQQALQSFGQDEDLSHGTSSSISKASNLLERKFSTNSPNNTIAGNFLLSSKQFCSTLKLQEERVQINCLIFLLKFIRDHHGMDSSPSLLQEVRGALSIAGMILYKSKACRRYFCSPGTHATWKQTKCQTITNDSNSSSTSSSSPLYNFVQMMNNIILEPAPATTMSTKTKLCSHQQKILFQKEALVLLSQLADQFGHLYPHFIVALRFLQEKKGIFNIRHLTKDCTSTSSTTKRVGGGLSQYALTTSINAAINYGEQECQRIMNIVSQMKEYFEILVPRLDTRNYFEISHSKDNHESCDNLCSSKNTYLTLLPKATNDFIINDDGDNDEVEWEEGDVAVDIPSHSDDVNMIENQLFAAAAQDHEAAVERTLLAAFGGSGIHGYTVSINFDNSDDDEVDRLGPISLPAAAATMEEGMKTRSTGVMANNNGQSVQQKLIHLTETLCQRHIPVLDVWTESLQDFSSIDDLTTTTIHKKQKMKKHIIKLKELFRTVKIVASSTVDQSFKFINRGKHGNGRADNTCGFEGTTSAFESFREESASHLISNSLHVLPWKRSQSTAGQKHTSRRIKMTRSK